jgi:hypothetical protein
LRIVVWVLGAWIALRWLGFIVGLLRIRRFEGPVRREARRTVVGRGAWNIFFTVAWLYAFAAVDNRQPEEQLVGFLAAVMMCSLFVGIASFFMQPEERDPRTLEICRLRPLPDATTEAEAQPT